VVLCFCPREQGVVMPCLLPLPAGCLDGLSLLWEEGLGVKVWMLLLV
jgi:hypothetical protein